MLNIIQKLTALVMALSLWSGIVQAAEPERPLAKPIAALYAADWCPGCKVLKPKYAQAMSGLENRIQFVTFDKTDDATELASEKQSATLGIENLYTASRGTGWVDLIDRDHHSIGRISSAMSVAEIRDKLEALANTAPK